jgi:hypothetical protein
MTTTSSVKLNPDIFRADAFVFMARNLKGAILLEPVFGTLDAQIATAVTQPTLKSRGNASGEA